MSAMVALDFVAQQKMMKINQIQFNNLSPLAEDYNTR